MEQLAFAFMGYAKKSMEQAEKNDEDYEGSIEMTAASCLSTIKSILTGGLP